MEDLITGLLDYVTNSPSEVFNALLYAAITIVVSTLYEFFKVSKKGSRNLSHETDRRNTFIKGAIRIATVLAISAIIIIFSKYKANENMKNYSHGLWVGNWIIREVHLSKTFEGVDSIGINRTLYLSAPPILMKKNADSLYGRLVYYGFRNTIGVGDFTFKGKFDGASKVRGELVSLQGRRKVELNMIYEGLLSGTSFTNKLQENTLRGFKIKFNRVVNTRSPDHKISLRSRELMESEYRLINQGKRQQIDPVTLIKELNNNDSIQVLGESGKLLRVIAKIGDECVPGYIVKTWGQGSTVK